MGHVISLAIQGPGVAEDEEKKKVGLNADRSRTKFSKDGHFVHLKLNRSLQLHSFLLVIRLK